MYSIYTGLNAIYAPSGSGSNYLVQNPRYQQEVNKAGQLEFIMTAGNPQYGKLKRLVTPISLYQDDEEIFFGRVIDDETDFYNSELVTAEGALAFLNDSVMRPFSFTDESASCVKNYIKYVLNQHNKQVEDWKKIYVGRVTVTDSNNYLYRWKDSYNSCLDVLKDHTINTTLGGYLSTRRKNGKTYLDYTAEAGEVSTQTIEFGVNLLDLTRFVSAENVFTVIVPIGKEVNGKKTTIRNVNNDKDYLESASGIKLFGKIWKAVEYPDIGTAKALKSTANKDLKAAIREAISIDIKAVDLNLINPDISGLKQGTMVRVISTPHGIDEYLMCRKVDINLNEPDDAVYTLGAEMTTLSGKQANTQRGVVLATTAADSAMVFASDMTELINHIIIGGDEDVNTD